MRKAGWAMSQDWYRADLHLTSTGAVNLGDFLDYKWEPGFTHRKAEDLYVQAATWIASDISANGRAGDPCACASDARQANYISVADNALEMAHLERAEFGPIPSIWGHVAGSPSPDRADFSFLRAAVRSWLE